MKIVVDAMGGDRAPYEQIKGAMLAVDEFNQIEEVILVGDKDKIEECVERSGIKLKKATIRDCKDVITMHDDPKSVLKRKDSSMYVGLKMIADGEGDGFVSSGNTGALTVGSTLIVKRINGVKRPAIASMMPSGGRPFLLLDCGANAECRSEFLYQFGLLGSLYMENVIGVKEPQVSLLNNGEEETKGTPIVKEAHQLMKNAPYNFIGNIEARQIPYGVTDVVVADGFAGNIALKMYEGVAKVLLGQLKDAFYSNIFSKMSYLGVKSGLDNMKKQFDYKEYGGAVMLGISKPVFKSHGSADSREFKNAIKQMVKFIDADLISKVEQSIKAEKLEDDE